MFDAITHARVYKEAWTMEDSLKFMKENSGKIFDPDLLELFIKNFDAFLDIFNRLP